MNRHSNLHVLNQVLIILKIIAGAYDPSLRVWPSSTATRFSIVAVQTCFATCQLNRIRQVKSVNLIGPIHLKGLSGQSIGSFLLLRHLFPQAWCPFDRYDGNDRCDCPKVVNLCDCWAIAESCPFDRSNRSTNFQDLIFWVEIKISTKWTWTAVHLGRSFWSFTIAGLCPYDRFDPSRSLRSLE